MAKLSADKITDKIVGKRLVRYSHLGEEPSSPERRMDQDGNDQVIVGVRDSDDDNTVALLLHDLLTETDRDPDGTIRRDPDGKPLRRVAVPHQGWIEVGLGDGGWIEVD